MSDKIPNREDRISNYLISLHKHLSEHPTFLPAYTVLLNPDGDAVIHISNGLTHKDVATVSAKLALDFHLNK